MKLTPKGNTERQRREGNPGKDEAYLILYTTNRVPLLLAATHHHWAGAGRVRYFEGYTPAEDKESYEDIADLLIRQRRQVHMAISPILIKLEGGIREG